MRAASVSGEAMQGSRPKLASTGAAAPQRSGAKAEVAVALGPERSGSRPASAVAAVSGRTRLLAALGLRSLHSSSAASASAVTAVVWVGLSVLLLSLIFGAIWMLFRKSVASNGKGEASDQPTASLLPSASKLATSPPGSASALLATRRSAQAPPRSSSAAVGPPVLCPALVLPSTEARFMIAMDSLRDPSAKAWDITGTSGRKLLHAFLDSSLDGGRCLKLCSVGCEDDPRAVVCTDPTGGPLLRIFGRGGGPPGMVYGTLGASHDGKGVELVCEGIAVMLLQVENAADLQMSALTMDGKQLAIANRATDPGSRRAMSANGGGDAWRLQVKPGVDAVLVAACMLSAALLQPDLLAGRPRGRSPLSSASGLEPPLLPHHR